MLGMDEIFKSQTSINLFVIM
uniref:Uncharacterized protein n=1 Tax=Arundo donax TaxID=35708 RepID=A0A0A9HF21_ARUDO